MAPADDLVTQVDWRFALAGILAHRGEPDDAQSLGREASRLAGETGVADMRGGALLDLAHLLTVTGGSPAEIAELTRAARSLFLRKGNAARAVAAANQLAAQT
jgi:hypothetical protein